MSAPYSQTTKDGYNSPGLIDDPEMPKKEEKEQAKVDELRSRLQDVLSPDYEDFYLRKWLKARSFDVNKAEQMFRKSVAYKNQMRAQYLLTEYEPPEVLQKYLTGGFCGHDKEGSQIRVELYGHLDMKGIMASVRKSDLEKTKLLQCETTVDYWHKETARLGRRVDGLTVIFDMEGVTTRMLWRPGLQMYLHLVKVLEDNYPEMLKRLLVINAPRIFPILYKLVRPLISDEMKDKIHVIGGDFKTHLLKYIDADQLPVHYGGSMTDPDGNPKCVTLINQGGDVPEEYFLDVKELYEHMKTHTIPRGEKFKVPFQVEMPGAILRIVADTLIYGTPLANKVDSDETAPTGAVSSGSTLFANTSNHVTMRWEFKTEDYDVAFGVFYTDGQGKSTPVVPVARVNSHVVAEDGSITCDKPGQYYLCFDNSFSWTRAKKIYYEGEVILMSEEDNKFVRSEIHDLVNIGDWETLADKFETTHF